MEKIKSRIEELIRTLQKNIYEKEDEVTLALLAALAGESILLLGPPGVAKSMIARRLKKAFAKAQSFEYLMSRFSTPDEIFGPISIAKLKNSDKYERAIQGYLPTADVVFLDEIWKAGPAIQNTLLTVMNEKLFRNGDEEIHLPLKLLVAASNELPAKGEGLEALWDRFMIRVVCHCIEDENIFREMLTQNTTEQPYEENASDSNETKEAILPEEYSKWQYESQKNSISNSVLEAITYIRKHLQQVELETTELPRSIYISDRRWKHIANLLRTSAFLQDRKEVISADLLPMYHCLWNEPEEIDEVRRITIESLFEPIHQRIAALSYKVKNDLRACQAQSALQKAIRENDHRDEDLVIANRIYYQIENHGTGHTYIYITDFKRLPTRNFGDKQNNYLPGIIYTDPQNPKHRIIRIVDTEEKALYQMPHTEQVTLYRDDKRIYLNGMAFNMRRKGNAILNPAEGKFGSLFDSAGNAGQTDNTTINGSPFAEQYETEAEEICQALETQKEAIDTNLFVSTKDRKEVADYIKQFNKQIAMTRVDIRKLLYNEE